MDNDLGKWSKILEDRINIIENSSGNSFIDSPINKLQSKMISNFPDLGLEYLLNFQMSRYGDAINLLAYSSNFYKYINFSEKYKESTENVVFLKEKSKESEIEKLILKRRSIRQYKSETMKKDVFSNLMQNFQTMSNYEGLFLKNTSSGGGLYPIDVYVYINNVENIENSLYLWQPLNKTLKLVEKSCFSQIMKIFKNQVSIDIQNANLLFLFSIDYIKIYQKYSNLALALGFIEVGIIAQTLHLLAQQYGYGSCDIGGFDKIIAERLLNLDGINKHAVYAVSVGRSKYV